MADPVTEKAFKEALKNGEVARPADEKISCSCGSLVLAKNLSVHIKTQKHLKMSEDPEKREQYKKTQEVKEKAKKKKEPLGEETAEEDLTDEIDEIHERFDHLEEMVREGFTTVITMLQALDEDVIEEETEDEDDEKDGKDEAK